MIPLWLMTGRLGNQMFQFAYLLAQQKRGLIPDTWLQYPERFAGAEKEVRDAFSTGIVASAYVSIHVRRGDYVNHPMFFNLGKTDYYEQAIAMFPGREFRVFSDDLEWCKKKWGDDPRFTMIEGHSEIQDMNLMAGCEHNIIANSSFSWWAGWLNPNPKKVVVYPLMWHTDGVQRVGFPKEWKGL